MAWEIELPSDSVVAGTPGHPGMHNSLVKAIAEVRETVDELPTPTTPDADDIAVDNISGTSGADTVQEVLENLASRVAALENE